MAIIQQQNQVYDTVDNGYMHIAIDQHYQGKICSYNNAFTRFFTKLFQVAIDVNVNGKLQCLNKNSYMKFLSSHHVIGASIDTIDQFKNFNSIQYGSTSNDRGFMRQYLSARKGEKLGRKLVNALATQDMVKATKMLGKGAAVDHHFWIRDYDSKICFGDKLTESLPHRKINPFRAVYTTPFLLSHAKQKYDFADSLRTFGANTNLDGNSCSFSRDIIQVNQNTSFETQTRVEQVPIHHHNRSPLNQNRRVHSKPGRANDRAGRPHHHGPARFNQHYRVISRPGLDLVTKQAVIFQDTYSNRHDIRFNPTMNIIVQTPSQHGTQAVQWAKSDEIGRAYIM